MTNALATFSQSAAIELSEADKIFIEEGAQFDTAFKYKATQLTVASSGVKAFTSADGEMIQAPLTGIVIGGITARGVWREGNKVPFCSSIGGKEGFVNPSFGDADFRHFADLRITHPAIPLIDANAQLPAFSCAACPLNQWGSSEKGRGKACTEKRRLLIVVDGWSAPAILNLPVMSVGNWDSYCSSLRAKFGTPFYAVRTEFIVEKVENDKKQPYGVVSMKLKERITDPAMARAIIAAQKEFASVLQDVPMEDATYEPDTVQVVGEPSMDNIPF